MKERIQEICAVHFRQIEADVRGVFKVISNI